MNLFSVESKLAHLSELLGNDELPIEEKQHLFETYLNAEETFNQAVSNICDAIGILNAKAKFQKDEANRIADLAKVNSNQADRLKTYLRDVLERRDITKLELDTYKLTMAKGTPKVLVNDDIDFSKVPKNLKRVKVELDKTAVGVLLKAGKKLAFAYLSTPKHSLRIK